MKKIMTISIFIFLTGLFSGLFFSMDLSEENSTYLSSFLLSSIRDDDVGFGKVFISSLLESAMFAAAMALCLLSKKLCPLPMLLLWFKSFALGFCSGLIQVSDADGAMLISLGRLLPPAVFTIPGFIMLASSLFLLSYNGFLKGKRPSREKEDLKFFIIVSLIIVASGSLTEALCHVFFT